MVYQIRMMYVLEPLLGLLWMPLVALTRIMTVSMILSMLALLHWQEHLLTILDARSMELMQMVTIPVIPTMINPVIRKAPQMMEPIPCCTLWWQQVLSCY